MIVMSLTNLLKTKKLSKKKQKLLQKTEENAFDKTDFLEQKDQQFFQMLKKTFAETVMTEHFDSERETMLKTDALNAVLSEILLQKNKHEV